MTERNISSSRLPGGDLVSAVLNREVMGIADRGGASNLVGSRWADLCNDHVLSWVGSQRLAPDDHEALLRIEEIARLDLVPRLAKVASGRGLQNPDFLLVGERAGAPTIQAVDAKFSVETARSKQVSVEMVEALLTLRDVMPELFGHFDNGMAIAPGVFMCPDYLLTHLMLKRRSGIVRTTVREDEVAFVPVDPVQFFAELEGQAVMGPLAEVDGLPVSIETSMLAALYYFRLARAAIGCWSDSVKPLLLCNDVVAVDENVVAEEARRRAVSARSAVDLVWQWDADVQTVRDQRAAVEQVAGLPVFSKELRGKVEKVANGLGAEPPSLNQVRRRLGGWWRGELRDRIGPLHPPVANLPETLMELAKISRDLSPRLPARLETLVAEMIETANKDA